MRFKKNKKKAVLWWASLKLEAKRKVSYTVCIEKCYYLFIVYFFMFIFKKYCIKIFILIIEFLECLLNFVLQPHLLHPLTLILAMDGWKLEQLWVLSRRTVLGGMVKAQISPQCFEFHCSRFKVQDSDWSYLGHRMYWVTTISNKSHFIFYLAIFLLLK